MARLFFEAQDTLFFRDGRPFNQGEVGTGIESLFPPSPMTLLGAARAAWARSMGWPGKGKWKDSIGCDLGGDDDELTGIECAGPVLFVNDEPVFPAPAVLMGRLPENEAPNDIVRLYPADMGMHCDLGEDIRLPVPEKKPESIPVDDLKLLDNWWLTRAGFERVIHGLVPDRQDFICSKTLWSQEPRVGIEINDESGLTEQAMLYSIQHIRMKEKVRLAMRIEGDLRQFPDSALVPLGGEARSCWLERQDGGLAIPNTDICTDGLRLRYVVFVLTPLNPSQEPKPGQPFENLPGEIISACVPRAQRWGGWDTVNWQPRPMQAHLSPGSVIFIEADSSDKNTVQKLHGKTIGRCQSWGFGLIAIGQWQERRKT